MKKYEYVNIPRLDENIEHSTKFMIAFGLERGNKDS